MNNVNYIPVMPLRFELTTKEFAVSAANERIVKYVEEPEEIPEIRTVRYIVPEGQEKHLNIPDYRLCCGDIINHPIAWNPKPFNVRASSSELTSKLLKCLTKEKVKEKPEPEQKMMEISSLPNRSPDDVQILSPSRSPARLLSEVLEPSRPLPEFLYLDSDPEEDFPKPSEDWPIFLSDEENIYPEANSVMGQNQQKKEHIVINL